MIEETLSLIKPDAVKKSVMGNVISFMEGAGLRVVAIKMMLMTEQQARAFYSVHKDKPFFPELVNTITAGPIVAMVLEGKNAIKLHRQLIGHTDPAKAEPESLRARYGDSLSSNGFHGSDGTDTAKAEIDLLFTADEKVMQ